MARMVSFIIRRYITDLDTTVNITAKVRHDAATIFENLMDFLGLQPDQVERKTRGVRGCASGAASNLFVPRKFIACFENGSTTEFPVPINSAPQMRNGYNYLIGEAGALSVALDGEDWNTVPATLVDGTPTTTALNNAGDGSRISGTAKYTTDTGFTDQTIGWIQEADPEIAATTLRQCLAEPQINTSGGSNICSDALGTDFIPRYIIGYQNSLALPGDPEGNLGVIARKIPSSASGQGRSQAIRTCIKRQYDAWACKVGYKGESWTNLTGAFAATP